MRVCTTSKLELSHHDVLEETSTDFSKEQHVNAGVEINLHSWHSFQHGIDDRELQKDGWVNLMPNV